ncbi:hypothetical protein SLEP1_g40853 [Rubroshorea leprosula]|uniref:Uncharacterized protein n=1 Tax=Rubroshorea leprosula TaxID=152421 RepID=A0AAV5L507_9ROSI|nr:hypothetical protein SLEP1_g40853 [Rubroshorea leprosula]
MRDPEPSSVEPSKQSDTLILENKGQTERPSGLGGVLIGIGEQVYPILLLIFFFLEVKYSYLYYALIFFFLLLAC